MRAGLGAERKRILSAFSRNGCRVGVEKICSAERPTDVTTVAPLGTGTTNVPGSTCNGDTYLRLLSSAGDSLAENDDAFPTTRCSFLTYRNRGAAAVWCDICRAMGLLAARSKAAPGLTRSSVPFRVRLRTGCFSSTTCSGTTMHIITSPTTCSAPPPVVIGR